MTDQKYQVPLDRTANVPVSEGLHLFTVSDVSEGEGGAGPYWRFALACMTPGEEGKEVTLFLSLSQQARWKLEIFLDAVGAPGEGNATSDKFIGRQFKGEVTHGKYEGRLQANIGAMFSVNAATPAGKPAAPTIVKSAKVVEEPAQVEANVPAPVKLPDDGTVTQNDIPF